MDTLLDVIREIMERADESKANGDTEFEQGRRMAFSEVLSLLKTDFTGEQAVEKLLDFDIDARYN